MFGPAATTRHGRALTSELALCMNHRPRLWAGLRPCSLCLNGPFSWDISCVFCEGKLINRGPSRAPGAFSAALAAKSVLKNMETKGAHPGPGTRNGCWLRRTAQFGKLLQLFEICGTGRKLHKGVLQGVLL